MPPSPVLDDALLRDVVGWDVRTWSAAVRFWESRVADAPPVLDCLELGAGPGGPSLWLALKGHRVICSSPEQSEALAAPLHSAYDLPGVIQYQDLDARDLPFRDRFDLIVFKSVLGGVGDRAEQERALAEILAALKPGGRLLFAENVRATVLHRAARAVMNRRRGANWRFNPVGALTAMLGGFAELELETTGVLAMFGPTEGARRALAGADRGLNRVTPARWRYLAYGVATK